MRLSVLSALLLVSYLVVPGQAFALIDISPKEIVVQDKPTTVQIINNGERPEYVSITLSRLLNPGVEVGSERLEPITLVSKPILYAYPFRITLAPGQSKSITLKPLEEVVREQVYRLDVIPIISLEETEHRTSSGNVLINLSFSGLVRQLPNVKQSKLSVTCESSGALLTANGNVRYPVKDVKVDGSTVDPFNVYPGEPRLLQGKSISIPGQPSC
jgi:hypothetical protein